MREAVSCLNNHYTFVPIYPETLCRQWLHDDIRRGRERSYSATGTVFDGCYPQFVIYLHLRTLAIAAADELGSNFQSERACGERPVTAERAANPYDLKETTEICITQTITS